MQIKRLRVGVIGAGEVAQTTHLPTIQLYSEKFEAIAICDVNSQSLNHCAAKFNIPHTYMNVDEMLDKHLEIDVVMIINSTEYHCTHAVASLKRKKHVFIEKPMVITHSEAKKIEDARVESGCVVFVGYMRRYATAFERVKALIKNLPIKYVRIRDIIGKNELFIRQSGSFPQTGGDVDASAIQDRASRSFSLMNEALGPENSSNPLEVTIYYQLAHHASHDLSAMRELFGMPRRCISAAQSSDGVFINALFDYGSFQAAYEMGVDNVADFDAHIEIFTPSKRVKIQYNTPYVKGLPINIEVKGFNPETGDHTLEVIRPTFMDTYTLEYSELYDAIVHGQPWKTPPSDAAQDVVLFGMVLNSLRESKSK